MRILFTGASSFTGYWFVRKLIENGHEVLATFTKSADAYEGVRRVRVQALQAICDTRFQCVFGDDAFLHLITDSTPFDAFCHHAAEATNYRSMEFDVAEALKANTRNIADVLVQLTKSGCSRIVLTGSVFEPNEGQGSEGLVAFSPYGLAKSFTAQLFNFHATNIGLHYGKFVIPNPFGPFEEPRFTAYLMNSWVQEEKAQVRTPAYIRDNIHVDLLAACYSNFVTNLPDVPGISKISPSGYIESQGAFAARFRQAIQSRSGWECNLELSSQSDFDEPHIRINSDVATMLVPSWNESEAWDALWTYYDSLNKQTR